jgi:nitroreductase
MIELLASRRSIRSFSPKEVSSSQIDALVHAALLSASSRALRPWEIIAVTDRDLLRELSQAKAHGSALLNGAPLGFVVLGLPDISDVWIEDASIVASNLLLEAHSLGLGACWVQIRGRMTSEGSSSEAAVRRILEVPDSRSVEAIVAAGYPAEKKSGYAREDLHWEKVRSNSWNILWESSL